MSKILFIEDDPNIAKGVIFNLEQSQLEVIWAKDLSEAQSNFKQDTFDLILTDLNLPDGNGLTLCREIRDSSHKIPIIIMTAMVDEQTVLEGFEVGANDYIKKPFSNKELVARVKANLPKVIDEEDMAQFNGLSLKSDNPEFIFKGMTVSLTKSQHLILYNLVKNKERVVTREMLLDKLGSSEDVNDRTIDSHLSQLRRKLKSSAVESINIKSVYGLGYRIEKTN